MHQHPPQINEDLRGQGSNKSPEPQRPNQSSAFQVMAPYTGRSPLESATHPYLFPSFSLPDVLCDPTVLIWRKGTPFEAMTGRTAPLSFFRSPPPPPPGLPHA